MKIEELPDLLEQAAAAIRGLLQQLGKVDTARETPVDVLNLGVRVLNCLDNFQKFDTQNRTDTHMPIRTVEQLCSVRADELLDQRNFGVTSLHEVREKLSKRGLKLSGE